MSQPRIEPHTPKIQYQPVFYIYIERGRIFTVCALKIF